MGTVRKVNQLSFIIDKDGNLTYESVASQLEPTAATTSYISCGNAGRAVLLHAQIKDNMKPYYHGEIWTPNKRISIIHAKRLWNHLLIEPYQQGNVYQIVLSKDYQAFYLQLAPVHNPMYQNTPIRLNTDGNQFYAV